MFLHGKVQWKQLSLNMHMQLPGLLTEERAEEEEALGLLCMCAAIFTFPGAEF